MEQLSLFLVVLLALVIPIFMARFKVTNVPTAVAEIIVGIIMGTSGFNLVKISHDLTFLSNLGVILLMFLSGMEIDFELLKRKNNPKTTSHTGQVVDPLKTATAAFFGIAGMSVILAFFLKAIGLFSEIYLASIIFMTIALGVVIATLKEKDILNRPIGQTILLTAVMGEVIPLLLLTIYASINGGDPEKLWLIILLFVAAIFLLYRFRQPYNWFVKVTKSTTQIDIRLAFFLIFSLVTVAESVGAENILGAFLAGMVMKLLEPSEATKDKLTSIGYGFFIPIFFIVTGVNLNLRSLFARPSALMLLPVLVICFFLAKLPVVLLYFKKFNRRNAFAGGFLTATTITIVLPTLQVARRLQVISAVQSDAFILAAVIVCIVSPIIFNSNFKLTPEDRIKQLGPVLQAIRQGLLSWTTPGSIAIIDSYPLPLCQYVRNFHACAFAGYADIGYNATKKQHFYGFKVHMAVTPSGLILNYVVTPASLSDVKVALTVTQGCPYPNILADVDLRAKFARRGYNFWTPYRSNMKGAKEHNNPTLKRTRRLIETTFAKLTAVGSEQTCTRSLAGLRAQIESIILAHNLEILGNGIAIRV